MIRTVLTSRTIDLIEERELLPSGRLRHQFSARGHELIQAVLAEHLRHEHDAAMGYYRSRPFLLGAGLTSREAFAASLGLATSPTGGRDVGVVLNLPARRGVTVLPTAGDVGAQYTPIAGWAQAIDYHCQVLRDARWQEAIAVAMGGDGSVATSGFWSALTLATTLGLPMLFVIEDNDIGISTPGWMQTPGGNIAANLRSLGSLYVLDGSGSEPEECRRLVADAVSHVRVRRSPALLRVQVPRLCAHSGLDVSRPSQSEECDPLMALQRFAARTLTIDEAAWNALRETVEHEVRAALAQALRDPTPDARTVSHHMFAEAAHWPVPSSDPGACSEQPVSFKEAVRLTLEYELAQDQRVLLFGEDIGKKGGVHGVTLGMQDRYGPSRVCDTSLSEEGILGRAIGLALAGLRPVPEIQFRKYLDPGIEQFHNIGTLRWRTNGTFAAKVVVRIPVGYHNRVSDPWHSVSGEAELAHALGWKIAFPANARDAVGLLRQALRSEDPTIFLEHRNLLQSARSATIYPGHDYLLPFGQARVLCPGTQITVVCWGDMVYRVLDAGARFPAGAVEIIDLRTIIPWDRETVERSVARTGRCLIVHEDSLTAGFGAEIAATVASAMFLSLEAPVMRLATPDLPIPYQRDLLDAVLPSTEGIAMRIADLMAY